MKFPALLSVCAAAVAALASFRAARAAPATRPPNIILLLADDLGCGEISAGGQQRYRTPRIDRLAAEGMAFSQAYAGSAICAPSRNCLMTGQHTGHATIRANFAGGASEGERIALRDSDVTVAARLRTAGYATALIGKWGLGEPDTSAAPWRKGWDFFYGFVNQKQAHNQYPEFLYRNAVPEPLTPNFAHAEKVYANDRFTDEALAFIARERDHPFFLFMSYTTPHAVLKCPEDSVAELKRLEPWAREPGAPPAAVAFAAMMLRLDRDIGRLLDRLHELGLENDTVVIFTGDNGAHQEDGKDNAFFHSSGPFRGFKRDLYEGGLREPFFVRWPGRIAPGGRSDHLLAFCDFSATMLDLAGLPRPADLPADGLSFAPTLFGQSDHQPEHDCLYWELVVKNEARQAVRRQNWKLVRYGLQSPVQLYDLATDPGETTDLSASHPEIVRELSALLTSARTESADFPLHKNKAKASRPAASSLP